MLQLRSMQDAAEALRRVVQSCTAYSKLPDKQYVELERAIRYMKLRQRWTRNVTAGE